MGKKRPISRRSAVPVLAFAGIAVSAFCIATTTVSAAPPSLPTDRAVGSEVAAATTNVPASGLVADTELCLAVSSSVEDAALAVEARGQSPRAVVVARLRTAEARIGQHLDAVDPRITAATHAVRDAIASLRHAIEVNTDIGVATGAVLSRIDDLDTACRSRLQAVGAETRS